MERILLSAFACDPSKGSEPANGWNWSVGLAKKGYEVHCLTRNTGRSSIESHAGTEHLYFHYVVLPFGLERLYSKGTISMYLYYLLWQWFAYKKAKVLHHQYSFSLAHHVTWGSLQMGSFLYKLRIPFVFGPAGGGQNAPESLKKYFLHHWPSEKKREKVSAYMLKYNPACKQMLKNATAVLVSNTETLLLAKSAGAKNVFLSLDATVPDSFFPEVFVPKSPVENQLKLLWVGRFMPRKGILLVLDVMKELKEYRGITLTVVGDGEMKDAFLEKIKQDQLDDTVHWKGKVPFEEVREYYASHDVFFFTSLRDSGPAQLVEAMSFGLPVVTINLHGQAMIVNEQRGILCAYDNPELAIYALKKAILSLYNRPETVEKMSQAAYDFASNQNWNKKIDTIVNEYYPV